MNSRGLLGKFLWIGLAAFQRYFLNFPKDLKMRIFG